MKFKNIINKLWESKGFTISILALLLPAIYIGMEFIRCNISYCYHGGLWTWEDSLIMSGGLAAFFLSILAMIVSIIREIRNKQNRLDKIGFGISLIFPIYLMTGFLDALKVGILGKILIAILILSILLMVISFFKKRRNR